MASTALAFFTWLYEQDIEIIPAGRYADMPERMFGYLYQFRVVLDALRLQEDFCLGMIPISGFELVKKSSI